MTDQAPTPGQVLDMLIKRYVPVTSPRTTNPDPIGHAKRQLSAGMLVEAFGQEHPLSRLVAAHARHERLQQRDPFGFQDALRDQEDAFRALQGLTAS